MNTATFYNSIKTFHSNIDPRLNTWANHLIVLFIFSMPIIVPMRRTAFFLLLVLFIIRGRYIYHFGRALRDPVIFAFSLYFLVFVIWLIGSQDPVWREHTIHNATFLLDPLLFATFIDRRYIPRMLTAFFLGMMTSEIVSYGIFFSIIPPMVHDGNQGTPFDPTPLYHHTHYGFMLAVTLSMILYRLIKKHDQEITRAIMALFFITASINLFITAGRTGYVLYGILIFSALFMIYNKKVIKPAILTSMICVIAFFSAYQFSATFHQRFNLTLHSIAAITQGKYDSSLGVRAVIYRDSLTIVKNNWLWGVGTGDQHRALNQQLAKLPSTAPLQGVIQHLHDEYLSAATQFGIIGFLVFLNIIFQLVRYRQDDAEKHYTMRIVGIAVAFFSIIDLFTIGLGAMLTTVILVSINLRRYNINNARFTVLGPRNILFYVLAGIILQLISV